MKSSNNWEFLLTAFLVLKTAAAEAKAVAQNAELTAAFLTFDASAPFFVKADTAISIAGTAIKKVFTAFWATFDSFLSGTNDAIS